MNENTNILAKFYISRFLRILGSFMGQNLLSSMKSSFPTMENFSFHSVQISVFLSISKTRPFSRWSRLLIELILFQLHQIRFSASFYLIQSIRISIDSITICFGSHISFLFTLSLPFIFLNCSIWNSEMH